MPCGVGRSSHTLFVYIEATFGCSVYFAGKMEAFGVMGRHVLKTSSTSPFFGIYGVSDLEVPDFTRFSNKLASTVGRNIPTIQGLPCSMSLAVSDLNKNSE
ncbi:hypothetical protein MLD38_015608 [Melastoma candidum]|uniref:Uncharacterized protein n=1 Tax=Melastoma candidum TaxID=119954 RepID=A0ACB9RIK9_9MYRT|nr:hypothetical protein MLD38_015608 [Melastoma candidum]